MSATEWKNKGNEAFQAGKFDEAIEFFSKAIQLDPQNHVLYSNRSAAFASQYNYEEAYDDAKKCTDLNPNWAKGYIRLGAAHHGLREYDDAEEAYKKGLQLEPENASLKSSLEQLAKDREAAAKGPNPNANSPFAKLFSNTTMDRIRANPRLAPYLAQPDYVQVINLLVQSPSMVNSFLQDQRIMMTMLELSGMDTTTMGKGASAAGASDAAAPAPEAPKPAAAPTPAPKPAPKAAASSNLSPAMALKEEGNALYKQRDFEGALAKYKAAAELEPTNTTFLLNMTAVVFEQGNYEQCLTDVENAIEHAREHKAEYTTVAKLLTRKGSCLQKLKRFDEAIAVYNKALLEHRNADTLTKLDACKTEKKKWDAEQYFDEALSLKAKEEGNAFFKADNFPEAVKCYDEAQKRNPKDHTVYSNRAAALLKLRAYEDVIRDCDACLAIKPDFVKAVTRKAHAYFWTKQYHKALTAYDEALKLDATFQEAVDGKQRTQIKITEMMHGEGDEEASQRALADPEIQGILQDSYMQMVLSEMQKDPKKINDYMRDPGISAKINKLIVAGVLRVGSGPQGAQQGQARRR